MTVDYSPARFIQASSSQYFPINLEQKYANPLLIQAKNYPSTLLIQNNSAGVLLIADPATRKIIYRAAPGTTTTLLLNADVLAWFSAVVPQPYSDDAAWSQSTLNWTTPTADLYVLDSIYLLPPQNPEVQVNNWQMFDGPWALPATQVIFGSYLFGTNSLLSQYHPLPSQLSRLKLFYYISPDLYSVTLYLAYLNNKSYFFTPDANYDATSLQNSNYLRRRPFFAKYLSPFLSTPIATLVPDTSLTYIYNSVDLLSYGQPAWAYINLPEVGTASSVFYTRLDMQFPVSQWPYQ